jgi:predicted nucleic acid-binding protein
VIVVDTNVLSEAVRRQPDPAVVAWLDMAPIESLFVTTITEAEVRFGIARMAAGARQRALVSAADKAFNTCFRNRVLPFDREAARDYAAIAAHRYEIGRPISQFDCQIAAIARSRGAILATRNIKGFDETGVDLVNPWQA